MTRGVVRKHSVWNTDWETDAFTKAEIQGMSVRAGGRVLKLLRSGKKGGRGRTRETDARRLHL